MPEQQRTEEEQHTARWAQFSRAFEQWLLRCNPTTEQAFQVMRKAGRYPDDPMVALDNVESLNKND